MSHQQHAIKQLDNIGMAAHGLSQLLNREVISMTIDGEGRLEGGELVVVAGALQAMLGTLSEQLETLVEDI